MANTIDKRTVFVRNLPFGVSQEELEECFSEIGPIRKVSVIKAKGSRKADALTKGLAFVKFTMESDAEAAIKKLNKTKFQDRTIKLELARKKGVSVEEADAAAASTKQDVMEVDTPKPSTDSTPKKAEKPKKQPAKKEPVEGEKVQSERNARRKLHRAWLREVEQKKLQKKEAAASSGEKTIVLYGMNSSVLQKQIYKRVKKIGSIVKVEVTPDARSSDNSIIASVEYGTLKDAEAALKKLDNHTFKGMKLSARLLKTSKTGVPDKDARLIIRNLSFEATEKDLSKLFAAYGPLVESKVVRMPVEETTTGTTDDEEDSSKATDATPTALGRSRGFGFVQFHHNADAIKAMENLNGTLLKGRKFAVDLSLPKAVFTAALEKENNEEQEEEEENVDAEAVVETEEEEKVKDDEEEESDEAVSNNDDSAEMDVEEEDNVEEGSSDAEEEEKPEVARPPEDLSNTLFLRNVSFESTEESIKSCFESFGGVRYAKICIDRDTGLSKGVAFVRFYSEDDAKKALDVASTISAKKPSANKTGLFFNSALQETDGIECDGRVLNVSLSVNRNDATRLADENRVQRKLKDRRNLYLQAEGYIKVNATEEAENPSLPKIDLERRQKAYKEKKEKLKDPLNFISPTRLCVRGLVSSVNDSQLRQLVRTAAIDGLKEHLATVADIKEQYQPKKPVPVKVVQAKVVLDKENKTPTGDYKSKGFAFVEFSEHLHAMAALRKLNNNPEFTKLTPAGSKMGNKKVRDDQKPRLMVEFALENHGKLKQREKRQELAEKRREEKAKLAEAMGDEKSESKKLSRGARQRALKRSRPAEEKSEKKEKDGSSETTEVPDAEEEPSPKQKQKTEATVVKAAKRPKTLSRKERKKNFQQNKQEEHSVDSLVQNYKAKLFGSLQDDNAPEPHRWIQEATTAAGASE